MKPTSRTTLADYERTCRWSWRLALLVMPPCLAVSGCAVGGAAAADGATAQQASKSLLPPDLDPDKALLSLDQIEPPLTKPQPPETIKPLSDRAAAQIHRARTLLDERRFTEASIALDRALRFDPDHPTIHATLAAMHWDAQNEQRAREHAQRAIEGNTDQAEPHYILARIAAAFGDHEAAIQSYRRALLCSDVANAPNLEARISFHLAQSLAEADYLQAAIDSYGRFLTAAADSSSLARIEPGSSEVDHAIARTKMAELLARLGRASDAADALAPAVEGKSPNPDVLRRYAEFLIAADRFDEAQSAVEALPEFGQESLELLESLYMKSGHPDRLIEALRARLRDRPHEAPTAIKLSRALAADGDSSGARTVLQTFLDRTPANHEVRLELISGRLLPDEKWAAAIESAAEGLVQGGRDEDYENFVNSLATRPDAVTALLNASNLARMQSSPSLYLLAVLAQAAGKSKQVEPLLKRAVDAQRDYLPARRALAEYYFDKFRYDEAIIVTTNEVSDIPADVRLAIVAGRAYERLDDPRQAELHLRAVTQLDRNNIEAMFELARVYLQSGRANLAQRQLQVLLEQDPLYDTAREQLAVLHMNDGKVDEAFVQVREMARLTKNPLTKARCDTLLNADLRRDADARRAALMSAIDEHGGDYTTWIAVAETYGDFDAEGRRDAYLRALEYKPDDQDALLGLVDAHQRLLDYDSAVERLEHLVRIRPNRDAWRLTLLDAYSVVGRDEQVVNMTSGVELRADIEFERLREYRSRRIRALKRLGHTDDLIASLQTWVEQEPDRGIWSLWLADVYMERKDFDRAIALYRKQLEAQSQEWGAIASLADALVKSGQTAKAAQLVLDRISGDPDSDQGAWMLAGVLSDSGHPDAAMLFIQEQFRRTRNREAFQDLLIDRYRAANRPSDAIEFIDSLIDELLSLMHRGGRGRLPMPESGSGDSVALRPNEPFTPESVSRRLDTLRLQKGTMLLADQQFREGADLAAEWLETAKDPGMRSRLLWLLAASQRGRGDEDGANESLRRALLLQPDNVSLNNDVSYALIDKGVELEDAEQMIRYAVWRRPEQPAYLDTYGWLLYKKGEFAEAEQWILRALRNQREPDAVILDHLGDIVWRLGRGEDALSYWRQAVARIETIDFGEPRSADERRVRDEAPRKIKAVESGESPPVAPLAQPQTSGDGASKSQTRADAMRLRNGERKV